MTEQTKEQFLAERQRGLGGSDAASVLGLSPYGGPMGVYRAKVYGAKGDLGDNERAFWGTRLEAVIREVYEERNECAVIVPSLLVHPEHPFLIGHVDGMVVNDDGDRVGLLEIKATGVDQRHDWGETGTDQIPTQYLIQVQHYLGLTDLPWCDVVVLIGGNEYRTYRIDRNQKLIDGIYKKEIEFWLNHVVPKEPPDVDGSPASNEVLVKMYPQAAGERDAWPEIDELASQLRSVQDDLKALEKQEAVLKDKIKQQMGPIAKVRGADYTLSWTEVKGRQTIDSKRLKEEQPEIAAKYMKVGEPTRMLRPYWKKGGE
jgi:putative phage-type endonuclease